MAGHSAGVPRRGSGYGGFCFSWSWSSAGLKDSVCLLSGSGNQGTCGAFLRICAFVVNQGVRTLFRYDEIHGCRAESTEQYRLHSPPRIERVTFHPDSVEDGANDVEARNAAGAVGGEVHSHALSGAAL